MFESLLDKSNAFLTNVQIQTIANVRERIGLKSFEIMFAVHRFVINFKIILLFYIKRF